MKTAFPPIVNAQSKILILGSMPGEASLAAQQYYAFGRNAFWPIMGELVGASPSLAYQQRVSVLAAADIAVWDVLKACEREGSLDSSIDEASLEVNDFQSFFGKYPSIRTVYFNGKTVQKMFNKYVKTQQIIPESIETIALPSTSPANARLSLKEKIKAWQVILN